VHDPDAGLFDEKAYRAIFLGVGVFRGTKGFRVQHGDDGPGEERVAMVVEVVVRGLAIVGRVGQVVDESERTVRTVKEKITTCLIQARLPKAYWAEIFYFAQTSWPITGTTAPEKKGLRWWWR
jgi:hypothetical protein